MHVSYSPLYSLWSVLFFSVIPLCCITAQERVCWCWSCSGVCTILHWRTGDCNFKERSQTTPAENFQPEQCSCKYSTVICTVSVTLYLVTSLWTLNQIFIYFCHMLRIPPSLNCLKLKLRILYSINTCSFNSTLIHNTPLTPQLFY